MGTPRLDSCIPLPIKREELEVLVDKAKDWALMHGEKNNFSLMKHIFISYLSYFYSLSFAQVLACDPLMHMILTE